MRRTTWRWFVVGLGVSGCFSACGGASGGGGGCSTIDTGTLRVTCTGSSSLPDVSEESSSRVNIGCTGLTTGSTASVTVTCTSTSDSLTLWCDNGVIDDSLTTAFASTTNCEDGQVSCFNGAINTTCVDTTTE